MYDGCPCGLKWRGMQRGERWKPEQPESYGILPLAASFPAWITDAIGYPYQVPFFGVFADRQWFNGKRDGQGYCLPQSFDALKQKFLHQEEHPLLFVYKSQPKIWQLYQGDEPAVLMWLELHAMDYPLTRENAVEYGADMDETPLLEKMETLLDDIAAKQKRFIILLNNSQN